MNLVVGCGIGQGRTHYILGQILIIYCESEFFPLRSGLCSLTLALAEFCGVPNIFSSQYVSHQSFVLKGSYTVDEGHV